MSLKTVSALNFSIAELTDIFVLCFQDYFVPVSLTPEMFAARFCPEDISFADSRVWLQDNAPVAIALIARRTSEARLAAFAVRPEFRGKGLAKLVLPPLLSSLAQQGVVRMSLEVIKDNTSAISLYQSLGFRITQALFGFKGQATPRDSASSLQTASVDALLRAVYSAPAQETPWLLDPLMFQVLPCRVVKDGDHAWAVIATLTETPQIRYLFVEPAFRRQGLASQLLMKINAHYPGIGTTVAVPESFMPLFSKSGYAPMAISQYDMQKRF